MKNKKKIVLSSALALSLAIPIGASAANVGNFSFELSARLVGSKSHSLSNKSTSLTSKGQSYYASGKVSPDKEKYTVQLVRSWLSSYSAQFTANNSGATKSVGVVPKDSYTVTITKNTSSSYADYVKGYGNINQ